MKNLKIIGLCLMMAGTFIACGNTNETTQAALETSDNKDQLEVITSSAEQENSEDWVTTDAEGIKEATGFEMNAPEGAEEISYSYLKGTGMAEMEYVLNTHDWVYRVQPTDQLEDISGLEYEWYSEEAASVKGMNGILYTYSDATEDTEYIDDVFAVHLVNWYDESAGVTHSLSVSGNIDGIDIEVCAGELMP